MEEQRCNGGTTKCLVTHDLSVTIGAHLRLDLTIDKLRNVWPSPAFLIDARPHPSGPASSRQRTSLPQTFSLAGESAGWTPMRPSRICRGRIHTLMEHIPAEQQADAATTLTQLLEERPKARALPGGDV